MADKRLSPDIYKITEYVNTLSQDFFPEVPKETLLLGLFGYMDMMFSETLQNSIVMASEFSNESIPTKAKFEKNIIAHALGLGVSDINAVPAQMDVLLMFIESDIEELYPEKKKLGSEFDWDFTFDRDSKIYFGDFEFHPDYDILIRKIRVNTAGKEKKFAYTAQYVMDIDNPVSDIDNPYLAPPVRMNLQGVNVLFTKCTLRQVEKITEYKKVLSDNTITAKTVTFTFQDQLAAFTIDVTEGNTVTHMIPVYEGLSVINRKYPYFYYTYLDANTIRIKFDRNSYMPRINSEVRIDIQTTRGENGNFTWNSSSYPEFAFDSDRCGYTNIACGVRPITNESLYGTNKKSIEELKAIIPKEALARGSITNLADLENYFNALDTSSSKLYFYKKRDNTLERLYYSYILIKNSRDIIIPTNTVDLRVSPSDLITEEGTVKLILKKGTILKLLPGSNEAIVHHEGDILPTEDDANYDDFFMYVIPYNFVINSDPLYGMYFLTTIDTNKMLDFTYINDSCLYQYIATSLHLSRYYIDNPDTYSMTIDVAQNITDDSNNVTIDEETGKIITDIRCIMVLYDEEGNPHRWAEAIPISYNPDRILKFKFSMTTKDFIDNKNRIRIDTGIYDINSDHESYAHFNANTKAVIHIISKQEGEYGLNGLDEIVPNIAGYSLSNSYTVIGGIDFFYDYSEIITSTINVDQDETEGHTFKITEVPVVKHDYFDSEDRVTEFCGELVRRKTYIDYAIRILEDAFGMNFKFFNTYGPSKLFSIDNGETLINRTNLTMTFKLKLNPNVDSDIINLITADIKSFIENINEVVSLHIPNLITEITTKYRDYIEFFEFVDMNGYGPGVQHIYSMDMGTSVIVPEFLNINTLNNGTPDINIILA